MEDNKYLYSVLNDKGLGQSSYANGDKNNSNMNLINHQVKGGKRATFVSRKSRHSFLDTFKQLNLKVVAEDIKHKLFEMNKNSNEQLVITEENYKEKTKEINKEIKGKRSSLKKKQNKNIEEKQIDFKKSN